MSRAAAPAGVARNTEDVESKLRLLEDGRPQSHEGNLSGEHLPPLCCQQLEGCSAGACVLKSGLVCRRCQSFCNAIVMVLFPIFLLFPPCAIVVDLAGVFNLLLDGRTGWSAGLLLFLVLAWRACVLYMTTRPLITRHSMLAMTIPGAAHALVMRAGSQTTAGGTGAEDGDRLERL
jgi:hypothetical protein